MAKKVRRVKKKRRATGRTAVSRSQQQTAHPGKPASKQTAVTREPASKQTSAEEFRQEYSYVLKDLRRILILAAIMFALLIVLNLVLQ